MNVRNQSPMLAKAASESAAVSSGSTDASESLLPPEADPDAVVDEIVSLLGQDRYQTARRMAAEAATRFPDHVRVRNAWGIFDNRGKARISPEGPQPSTHEEFEWLKNPPEWARGKWVALVGSEAVASADTLAEIVNDLRSKQYPRKPLVHRIDDAW